MAARIVRELGPRASETVIEIGPGRGALTGLLVESGARVIAVELDRELVPELRELYAGRANLSVVEADALRVDFCELIAPSATGRLISNLPYNVATAILQRIIEQRECLSELVVMLQREVVARITAAPGTPERGFFSVLVQAYCETEILFDVNPAAFRPAPKVWSSVIRLTTQKADLVGVNEHALFLEVLGASFAQRRKTLFNNLRAAPRELQQRMERAGGILPLLGRAGIDAGRRAETLTNQEWSEVVQLLAAL